MKKIATALIAGLLLCLIGCGDVASSAHTLTIRFAFSEAGVSNCTEYLADHFLVTLYNANTQTKTTTTVACTTNTTQTAVRLTDGFYYLTAALLDSNDAIKSWGSSKIDLSSDNSLDLALAEYRGGMTFSWSKSLCSDYAVSTLSFSALHDGTAASALIWGEEKEVSGVTVDCTLENFSLANVETGLYSVTVNGYRDEKNERPRITSSIPDFRVTAGQDTPIELGSYLLLTVSDLTVTWEFDSKSISSCADAGVATIQTTIQPAQGEAIVQESLCDTEKNAVSVYDLSAGDYTLIVSGVSATGTTTFSGEIPLSIEPGHVGKNGYTKTVYIKQK